jgi:two-component system OmpR family sensor kinase
MGGIDPASVRYAHRSISLRASTGAGGSLVLTVEDDGPGIPAADRVRVFEPFHRLDSSRDRHTGGFGPAKDRAPRGASFMRKAVRLDCGSWGARFMMTLPPMPDEATVA